MSPSPLPPDRSLSADGIPIVMVRDDAGRQLLCELLELLPIAGKDYGLLTPVDTPVCLFRCPDTDGDPDVDGEPELIEEPERCPEVLRSAEQALEAEGMVLIRSAVTLTVSTESPWDDEDPEEMDGEDERANNDDDIDFDSNDEVYEHLLSFQCETVTFSLYIPLQPFFVIACLGRDGGMAQLVEGAELERLQPLVQQELEERESDLGFGA